MAQVKYITVAELAEAFDTRLLGQLSSDTGTPATVNESNAPLLNAIERASGELERSALRGGRYSLAHLATLQTDDQWELKNLVATLAMGYVYLRRGDVLPEGIKAEWDQAREQIRLLRRGEMIFGHVGVAVTAGQPSVDVLTVQQRVVLGMVSDTPFFPARPTEVA